MCGQCRPTPQARGRLSRRAFLAGAALPLLANPVGAANGLVEPVSRLDLPPDAPPAVALTLDACAGATDARILNTLTDLGVPATIFVTGLWLRNNPPALARLLSRPDLFTLQNHGARHVPAVLGNTRVYGLQPAGTMAAIVQEVAGGAESIAATGAGRPRWYRGATGLYSPAVIPAIEATGFAVAGWSVNADAGASLPAEVVRQRIAGARNGDVIIAHINQPARASGAGVAAGIRALHEAGVRFVGLDGLPIAARRG
jgi:peptidoglycan/xylan/chitin deacetylase (PgdA/CDA1 family)